MFVAIAHGGANGWVPQPVRVRVSIVQGGPIAPEV